jgi:hypothetical protein
LQAPVVLVPLPVQAVLRPGTSSMMPLQSSSMPLQISIDLATLLAHVRAPAVH